MRVPVSLKLTVTFDDTICLKALLTTSVGFALEVGVSVN